MSDTIPQRSLPTPSALPEQAQASPVALRPVPPAGEPRGLSLADLLAVIAGISIALAIMPTDVRRLLDTSVWQNERSPQPQANLLMAFQLGSWLVVVLGVATSLAVAWRLVRYRRFPWAGEWVALLLLLVSALVNVKRWVHLPIRRSYRQIGAGRPLPEWLMEGTDRLPDFPWALGGVVVCLLGIGLLTLMRRAHPLFRTCWIVALLIVYVALPAQYGMRTGSIYQVPLWNRVSWQEFEVLSVPVLTDGPTWLPVAVGVGFLLRAPRNRSLGRWCWTEWAGPAMLLATLLLYALLWRHRDMRFPGWQVLLVALAAGIGLSWPLEWYWRRWCSEPDWLHDQAE